jgi:hypothetical protein
MLNAIDAERCNYDSMLSVIMLNVVMLSVVEPSLVAIKLFLPFYLLMSAASVGFEPLTLDWWGMCSTVELPSLPFCVTYALARLEANSLFKKVKITHKKVL